MPGSLVGLGTAGLVFVTGIALAVPAMITPFAQTAAPHSVSGMAVNGLVLFTGAGLGPLLVGSGLSFPVLLLVLTALLGFAAVCVTVFARLTTRNAAEETTTPPACPRGRGSGGTPRFRPERCRAAVTTLVCAITSKSRHRRSTRAAQ
ncbi:hypothetical protein [Nocardiopsis aegyptia]|uniref:Uncharacterized protein n=1 Tax=Nocardiopsis aegyptia TaxID=220378 RepID=A0A7Z0JAD6_9ACTN|nr:hypothetical protein [Nocardiopsis aegyptia]NYJ35026.1 hypothetical protein [Nocardiopsis aegyptia]